MSQDHSHDHSGHDDKAHNVHGHDQHDAHGEHEEHGHDDASSEASTLVPVTWRQLIFPALILLLVGILLIGPVTGAFAPRPSAGGGEGAPATGGEGHEPATSTAVAPTSTTAPAFTATPAALLPTSTVAAVAPTNTSGPSADALATRTAIALAGEQGTVTRAPVQLLIAGATYKVEAGGDILPDWKITANEGKAIWINGTYANHVIYLPYSEANSAIFLASKLGDMVMLQMDSGQSFEFQVTRSQRVPNGPPANPGDFTTSSAMAQDHAGVTIFLVGEPTDDRAVVQADFTGNIQ